MNPAVKEVLQIIGLGAPILYATATYMFFSWLDLRASGPAKKAINQWLKSGAPEPPNRTIVELFDRVYGSPLLSWRSVARSATFSTIVSVAYELEFARRDMPDVELSEPGFFSFALIFIALPLLFNIITDYISLFFVRRWLRVQWRSPTMGMLSGAAIGALVVLIFFLVRLIAIGAVMISDDKLSIPRALLTVLAALVDWDGLETLARVASHTIVSSIHVSMIIPAMIVHAWLVLFALSIALARLAGYFGWAVAKTQWALKSGNHHPLKAVGFVSAALVLAFTWLLTHAI